MGDTADPEVLDDEAAAALCDCEPATMQELARTGQLPAVKLGRSWRFPRSGSKPSHTTLGAKRPNY